MWHAERSYRRLSRVENGWKVQLLLSLPDYVLGLWTAQWAGWPSSFSSCTTKVLKTQQAFAGVQCGRCCWEMFYSQCVHSGKCCTIIHKHTHTPCTIRSVNILRCITQKLWVWILETKGSCFFLCLYSQLRCWNANGRGLSSKVTFQVRRPRPGERSQKTFLASWVLITHLPKAPSPLPSSVLTPEVLLDAAHIQFSISAFSFGVFTGMTRCTRIAKINTSWLGALGQRVFGICFP